MTAASARDRGLRRLSDLTTWVGVGALAVTGVFAALAAHASHATTTATSVTAVSASPTSAGGLAVAQAPVASVGPSHVRSGAS